MTEVLVVVSAFGVEPALLTISALREGQARYAASGLGSIAAPAQAPVAEALLDSRQLAELLNVGDTLLEQMAKDGRIPSVRVGEKHLRFQASEVLAALKRRHADSRTATPVQRHEFPERVRGRNHPATGLQQAGKGQA